MMSLMSNSNGCCKEQGKDRVSSLPDFLFYEILSLLPVKTAATTSVLSHHWRYLWTHITRISLPYPHIIINSYSSATCHKYFTIIHHILTHLSLLNLHSFRFGLAAGHAPAQLCLQSLQSWLPLVCSRNPEQITIETNIVFGHKPPPPSLDFPACIFQTQSLVDLKLNCPQETTYKLPHNGIVKLPNLKKLQIMKLGDSNAHLLSTLFKSCPLLQVLDLRLIFKEKDDVVVDISSLHLKSLKVDLCCNMYNSNQILIDAPKLENLRFTGTFAFYRFVKTPTTLRVAELDLDLPCFGAAKDGLSSLFRGIYCVKSLILFKTTLFALRSYSYVADAVLSFFRKLMRLQMFYKLQNFINVPRKIVIKKFRILEITEDSQKEKPTELY